MDKLSKVIRLRHEMHQHPELSGQEHWTRKHLMEFLRENTSLDIIDMGSWFYAVKKGSNPEKEGIAFRADYDALPIDEKIPVSYSSVIPGVSHKCGHDGHSAALCYLALMLEESMNERSIYLIFQPAEEIGAGGEACADVLSQLPVSEVYAWHNRSGYPKHAIAIKKGSIQCASEGLTILYKGMTSHASEPENGINPVYAIGELIRKLQDISPEQFTQRILYTIINVKVGNKDFGVSPGEGELSVTLRANAQIDLDALEALVKEYATELAEDYHLEVGFEITDRFPETANDEYCTDKVIQCAKQNNLDIIWLEEPWKASEDFGYYTRKCSGAMFYIGIGEDWPALHTTEYDFNDEILQTAGKLLLTITGV